MFPGLPRLALEPLAVVVFAFMEKARGERVLASEVRFHPQLPFQLARYDNVMMITKHRLEPAHARPGASAGAPAGRYAGPPRAGCPGLAWPPPG